VYFKKEKGKIILFYEIKSEKVFSLFSNKFDKCRDIWRFQYFLKILIFFCYSNGSKKIHEPFFLSKSKVQKIKNVDINHFYQNLKFYKYLITESQKKKTVLLIYLLLLFIVIIYYLNSLVPFFLVNSKVVNIRCSVET